MHNKISTRLGTAILIIIAITAVMFVWTYEKGQDWGGTTIQTPALNDKQRNSITEVVVIEPMSEWATYSDEKYGFEFKYPKLFKVRVSDRYLISDSLKERASFSVKKWKGYVIQENTPGTFWEKLSYEGWKYFSDNLQGISTGKCSNEAMLHVVGETVADAPKTCVISRQGDILKVETENRIIYFTKDIEIQWELNQDNKDLVNKITSTFVLK
ncbi:MAG: hypothetical protein WA082_02035 [Candidatus Moraniibacteriota bacterium]